MTVLFNMFCLWSIFVVAAVSSGHFIGPVESGELNDEVDQTPRFNPDDVYFYLWTRENRYDYQSIRPNDTEGSYFSSDRETKIFAHGWNDNGLTGWIVRAKEELLDKGDYNIISIDWAIDASSVDYFSSAFSVVNVGNFSASLIDALVANNGADVKKIHIVGSSLGAHVAGNTASHVTSGTVYRVTGLDPAHPAFTMENPERRLDITDGDFVDIIHTNMGTLAEGGLAFPDALGHVDFYPNGGHEQNGCFDTVYDIIDMLTGCSHRRAPAYYLESINSEFFVAQECDSHESYLAGNCSSNPTAVMGENVPLSTRGVYYLNTNAESPFAMG